MSDSGAKLPAFSTRLLDWWDRNGRQDLPWQHPRTPYRVWISEIMLQQTQVTTVIPYFERWLERFPDLASLAAAPLDDVLSLWAGLGYYARARNLHKTAGICLRDHDGELPTRAEELVELPGIGLSTANAIISQTTDRPAAVLDGNVRRVLARHMALEGWTGKASVQKELWAEAERRLPARRGADYTQAIMDLGALLCTRSKPACKSCPVSADCSALLADEVHRYPSPKPATRVATVEWHMLLIRDERQRILITRRPPTGIWGGLWTLPAGESPESIAADLGLAGLETRSLDRIEHRLSHRRLLIYPAIAVEAAPAGVKSSPDQKWIDPGDTKTHGMPRPVADFLNRIENGENA